MREMQAATATAPFSEQLQVNEMTAIDNSWVLNHGRIERLSASSSLANMLSRAILWSYDKVGRHDWSFGKGLDRRAL